MIRVSRGLPCSAGRSDLSAVKHLIPQHAQSYLDVIRLTNVTRIYTTRGVKFVIWDNGSGLVHHGAPARMLPQIRKSATQLGVIIVVST